MAYFTHVCELCGGNPEVYGCNSRTIPPDWKYINGKKVCYDCSHRKWSDQRTGSEVIRSGCAVHILKFLADVNFVSISTFSRVTGRNKSTVSVAMTRLYSQGYIRRIKRGTYAILEKGLRYLEVSK